MKTNLQNKVIMVAAGSKGLGFGIARAVASEGAYVSLASRKDDNVKAAVDEIRTTGGTANGYTFDASDAVSIQKWADDTVADLGRIAGLVVNAGGPPIGRFNDFSDGDWQAAFELTLLSAVRMIRAVLPSMKANGGGAIVTITSSSVKEPIAQLLLSNVMRSGVTSLAKSLATELAAHNIRVNNLIPGRIDTERVRSLDQARARATGRDVAEIRAQSENDIPFGRYGTIGEFGAAGAFLLSDAASYISGATLVIDGGTMRTVW